MEFDSETHQRTGCRLLKTSEELIETLEENQVVLQNVRSPLVYKASAYSFFLKIIPAYNL